MRVLTFLHSFEPGGVERIALRLVRHWREQGIDAPLFLGQNEGAMAADVGRGLAFTFPQPRRFVTVRLKTLWMILTLPRMIRESRPDILFCAGNTYAVVAVAMKVLLGRDCPPVLAKISNSLDRPDKRRLRRLAYRWWLRVQGLLLDRFVGLEMPMTGEIVENMGVPRYLVSIVPDPATSCDQIARLRTPSGTASRPPGRHFVAVGRLVPQKNLALMLRAFAAGAHPEDRLTLIGDGPERRSLQILTERLDISGRVDFRGYVSEPATLLPQFDFLLLSSNYEGVPAVVVEALAANLWIIATDCSRSMTALLLDGELGDLVPIGNEAIFARAIKRAEPGRQVDHLSRMQAERFTIDRAANDYLAIMRLLPAGRSTTRNIPSVN